MMRSAICDDEPLMAQELTDFLVKYMEEKSITAYDLGNFSNGRALSRACLSCCPQSMPLSVFAENEGAQKQSDKMQRVFPVVK